MIATIGTLAVLAASNIPGWLPTGFRWNTGQIPIPYCLSANASASRTNLSPAEQRAAMIEAIDYWRSSGAGGGMTCTLYNAAADTRSCRQTVDTQDGQQNIYFEASWQHGSRTLGVTWSSGFGDCGQVTDDTGATKRMACMGSPDIELNGANLFWDNGGHGSNTDLVSILTHEYGHFIGLDHCNDNNTCQFGTAVMYAAYGGGVMKPPRADDIQGACALYPGTPGGVGYPCTGNQNCDSQKCVSPGASGYCTADCGTCPQGFACKAHPSFPGGNVCVLDDGTNKGTCEICQGGLPNACAGNGVCVSGLPEQDQGRCAPPCPNPAGTNGGCDSLYQCVSINLGGGRTGQYCIPRSSDCTNLNNVTELQFGQTCTGNPPCAVGLDCIDICTRQCTGAPGQGDCPSGFACDVFNFQSGPAAYCAPPVNEGQDCSGFKACLVGQCLRSGDSNPICYRDCAGNPGACNNAQSCTTYTLSGGGSVSICEPPGVPPRRDGGVVEDTGVPGPDTGITTGDSGTPGTEDGGVPNPIDGGGTPGTCTCDQFTYCEANCACDQECPCTCDGTFACDEGCTCDPDCYSPGGNNPRKDRLGGGCACSLPGQSAGDPKTPLALAALLAGLLLRRRPR